MKRRYLLIILALLLFAIPGVLYYIFIHSAPIRVINHSKYYRVSFQSNDEIMKEIDRIGTFTKQIAPNRTMYTTLKRIIVETTDENRGRSRYVAKNKTVKNVDYEIVNDELHITWYLNKDFLKDLDTEMLSRFMLYDFLLAQRRVIRNTDEENKTILQDIDTSISRIPKNPFSVKVLQQ